MRRIAYAAFSSAEALRLAAQIQQGPAPTFHHPCGRRSVIVGKWGHQLAHPSDCPDCAAVAKPLQNNTGTS